MLFLLHTFLFIAFFAGALWGIAKWQFFNIEGTKREHLLAFFVLKVAAGIALIAVYTYYYTDQSRADVYRYFNDSVIISKLLFEKPLVWLKIMSGIGINEEETFEYLKQTLYFSHPQHDWVTDNTFIIRIHVLLNYLSFSNIYINNLLLNFASFAGLTAALKALKDYFPENPRVLYLPLFLIPSVVFWSSGPLKEQLLFSFAGFYLLALNKGLFGKRIFDFLFAAILLLCMLYVKPMVAVLLPVCSVFLPVFNLYDTKRLIAVGLIAVLASALVVSMDWHYKACDVLINKRNEFIRLGLQEQVGSYFDTKLINGSCKQLLAFVPNAIANAMLRPYLWEGGNVFQLLFALENTVLVLLVVYLLVRFFQMPEAKEKRLLFVFCLSFALLNYLAVGLTVPIMGAIVHYRVIASPFLLLAVLCWCNISQLKYSRNLMKGFTMA